MITPQGYSKDPSLIPIGVVVTLGKDMIEEKGGIRSFLRHFLATMQREDGLWLQKCKNRPTFEKELLYVYILISGQIKYRCLYGGYEAGPVEINSGEQGSWSGRQWVSWSRIILAGPIERAPVKILFSGFQGFRYCTKLF